MAFLEVTGTIEDIHLAPGALQATGIYLVLKYAMTTVATEVALLPPTVTRTIEGWQGEVTFRQLLGWLAAHKAQVKLKRDDTLDLQIVAAHFTEATGG